MFTGDEQGWKLQQSHVTVQLSSIQVSVFQFQWQTSLQDFPLLVQYIDRYFTQVLDVPGNPAVAIYFGFKPFTGLPWTC